MKVEDGLSGQLVILEAMWVLTSVSFRVRVWYGFGFAAFGYRCLATTTECCFDEFVAPLQYTAVLLLVCFIHAI